MWEKKRFFISTFLEYLTTPLRECIVKHEKQVIQCQDMRSPPVILVPALGRSTARGPSPAGLSHLWDTGAQAQTPSTLLLSSATQPAEANMYSWYGRHIRRASARSLSRAVINTHALPHQCLSVSHTWEWRCPRPFIILHKWKKEHLCWKAPWLIFVMIGV